MNLPVTPETLNRLEWLRQEKKFTETTYYPGAPTEEIRAQCEHWVNTFLKEIIAMLLGGVEKETIFVRAKALVETFDGEDTEEREKVGDYIGEAMEIIGLQDWMEHV